MPTHDPHRETLQDFLDSKTKLQAAKAEMNLSKLVRFEMPDRTNRVMTNAEFIQYALDNNLAVAATPEKGNIPEAKAEEIERAFSGFNENIVRRNLGSYYKPTPEMKAYEQLLHKMLLGRNEEKPSNQEYFKARKAAIDSIIDANTPTKTFYHVQYDSNGASMPISKTMYDYAAFIQKASIENLTRQLTDILSEPQFNEWLQKHEDGVVTISEGDLLRMNNGQLQLGWYHMPEGSKEPTFETDDLSKRDFYQQAGILREGIENATALHRDMQVENLLEQLHADRITLEEPMTVRLSKGGTVTITAVAQDKPGHDTYLVSDEGKPYIPYYVNGDDFDKVAGKAVEDGSQQMLVRQERERMEPALAEMRRQLLGLMQNERLMHFIAPFPEVRLSVGKDGEIYLKDGELRVNDFDHDGRQYDIPLAEERPRIQQTDLQEALQTAQVFQARMRLLENMEAAGVNQATLESDSDLTVRLRGWEETGDTHQVRSLLAEKNHFRVTDAEGNTFPSYDIIEEDETFLLNKVNDLLKEEMGITQSQTRMAHEELREVMRDHGIPKMELPDGESIELKGGQLTLHGHDGNGMPTELNYNDLPHDRQSDIFNHVAENIQKMEEDLAGEELKLAAMMVDMQTEKLYIDDSVATLYHIPDPEERRDIIVNAIRMDSEGELKALTDDNKEYPVESLHLPDRITVIGNAVRMVDELQQKEAEQALNPERQRMTYPQYLQQLMQVSKVQTLALYDGKVIDNKEGELIYKDLTRTVPFNDLPKEEQNALAWSGTELLVSHLESELERFVRNSASQQVSLPNGDAALLDDSRSYDKLRLVLHDTDGNAQDYNTMDKLEKVEVLTAFAGIAAQEARDVFTAHVAGRGDGRLHMAADNWIEQLPDTNLAIVRIDENGESKTLSFEKVNGFTQLNVVNFAAEQQEILDRRQAAEKAADQTALSQQPKGEETPSPLATDKKTEQADRSDQPQQSEEEAFSSPLATTRQPSKQATVEPAQAVHSPSANDMPARPQPEGEETPSPSANDRQPYQGVQDAPSLTRLMQEHQTDSVTLPWGDQVRLDENGTLMLHGHNEDATPRVFPFSELSETQQEVFARHAAESLAKNAKQQSLTDPSPSAKSSLSTGEGRGEAPSPTATDLSQEADRLRERVAALMAENEIRNVSFEPTTVHPFATWPNDIYADETQTMDGIHRDESGWLQMTDDNVLLNSVVEYLPQEQIEVLRKAETAILRSLGQQKESGNALQLDEAKIENFLGAEMLPKDRDAFLDKIRHNYDLMAVVEEKMNRRVQPNVLVAYAESELQAQEHRTMTMMKMLDEHVLPSWGGSIIEAKDNHLVWQKNDGSKAQGVLDMPAAIARTTLQMAIDDLTPRMEEKVKDLVGMEKDNVIFVNDIPVKVRTKDNDNNFQDAIVIPEKIGLFSDDQIYVQDTEGVRHSLNSLHDESRILLLNDVVRSSQKRSEEMDAAVDNQQASTQHATEPSDEQHAKKALVEQEQQRLMQIMRTANVSEVGLWDSEYTIELANDRLTLAEYADGTTKKTDILDLDMDAAIDTMGMAAAQITSNLKAALMDTMHDAGIKTYETAFKDSTATIDISRDDIQVLLGNDKSYMHVNELDDLTATELLTKVIGEVEDRYLKAWVGRQAETPLEDTDDARQSLQQATDEHIGQANDADMAPEDNPEWRKAAQLVNELGLEYTPLTLRTPVTIPADLDDWRGKDVLLSHVMCAGGRMTTYETRNDAYDDTNGINVSELALGTQSDILRLVNEQLSDNDRNITIYVDTANVPEWAMNALINGDNTGLTEKETQMVRDFHKRYPDHIFSPRDEDPSFDRSPAFGEATTTCAVDIVRIATPAILRQEKAEQMALSPQETAEQPQTLPTDRIQPHDIKVPADPNVQTARDAQSVQPTESQHTKSEETPSPLATDQKAGQTNNAAQSQHTEGNAIPSPTAMPQQQDSNLIPSPLADIKSQLRDSGLILMPVKFDNEDRRYMDINGWVRTPLLDFSPEGGHRPETVIAPVSVEYQKESDSLLLHGKNANGDCLTIPLESPTRGNRHAYTVIREQLEQPLQKAMQHASMVEYFADSSLENNRVSDTFIRSITNTVLRAQNGNAIHVGDYDRTSRQLHVTEKNELGHTVNDTWINPMRIAEMVSRKEAVATSKDNLAEASLSYPTLEEVMQRRMALEQSEQAKANEKYLYTLFESKDPDWDEKAVIIHAETNDTPWGKEVQLTSESNLGQMVFRPDDPYAKFEQTGSKIDGIITDISRLGFTDREKDIPYNLMDPISYCRDNGRTMGPDQTRYDGLMVDFGPNHFYFQQILSGPEEGRYHASYEIENLDHGTREKVVDANIDMAYERMRRALSHYDLRENQSHSLHETESLVRDITNHALDQMVTLSSRIYNIPTGDKEMADDPRFPVMDVSMIEVDRTGKIILHGNGGPAPLDSLDETARFEVLRRTINDMMDQNLDLQVKRERLMQHTDGNSRLTDIVKPFEYPRSLYDKDGGTRSVGALIVDDLRNITLFHNVAEAYDFLTTKDTGKKARIYQTDLNDLSPASQRKVLDGALGYYSSQDLQQQAYKEAEDHAERMTTRQYSSFTNNMSNPNSEEKIMRPEEQKTQVEQPKADQQQQAAASQSPAREQATEQIRAAIGPDQKVRLDENERVALETNKGATINVQTVSITKNETVSLYGEIEGSKKSVSASQLTDDSLSKLASHLDDLRSAKQSMAAEKPAEQKAAQQAEAAPQQSATEQKAQTQQPKGEAIPAAEQKAELPRERKVEPIEIKPDSKVEFNITKNPVLDRVYDIQLFVDGEKKAGHHLSVEDRKDFFDKKVTGPELVPKYFEKELAGQKLPEVIERHHAERKQEAQEQKPAQEQKAPEQKAEQPKERKADTVEIKPDSKVQVNVVPNKALDHVYDIQLYVDGQKQGRGHHLSIEDRKAFFDKGTPEEKTAFAASLLPKYFEKELAGQKLPDNIDRYRAEKKQEAQEQKPAQAAEQKPAQAAEQKTGQQASASPVDVWKDARGTGEQERMTFVQRDGQYGKFYQTYGADAAKVAQLTDKPTKEIKEGPNAQLAYINVKQADMPDLMKTMKEQEIPYKVVGMDGKYARVLPEAQAKTQAADLSGYKMPEGKQATDVKVWQFQGKPFMNGVVDGVKLDAKEISKEDWTAFKEQKATPEQMVGKYYAPAEMEAKQAQKQAKAMAR